MVDSAVSAIRSEFEALPLTARCRRIWERGEHALIGVSPGNGYFSTDRLTSLAAWAARSFTAVDVVYADLHLATVLGTIGYDREHATRKARKELEGVRRRIRRAVEALGSTSTRFRVSALSEFCTSPVYRELRETVRESLRTDDEIREACELMVDYFLDGKISGRPTPEQLRAGTDYLLAELPFFVDAPRILGVGSSVSCYHSAVPLARVLFSRREGLRAVDHQGYLVVRPLGPIPGPRIENTTAERNLRS
ncbi:tRNA-dependent cyclodipeptide synthase [Saccharopolyspora taberi]|uniref:Cyclodipeptide synthase n=1 Tax=Saccharopolyspora taberi TaxID=60895 RepID=A0ABN3VJ13_9PSEU